MKTHNFIIDINGDKFPISSYINFRSYFGGNGSLVEPKTREWFSSQIKSDDVVFDIGANIGLYSILFSQFTNNTYAFEPTDTYEFLLLPNLETNNIKNVKTYKLALGDKVGNYNDKIYMIWGEQPVEKEFDFTTLDEFSTNNNIVPKFIKIDVDGFDLEVLKGGKNLLMDNDITVCVEVNYALHTRGYKESNLMDFMSELGYKHVLTLDNENFIFKK